MLMSPQIEVSKRAKLKRQIMQKLAQADPTHVQVSSIIVQPLVQANPIHVALKMTILKVDTRRNRMSTSASPNSLAI